MAVPFPAGFEPSVGSVMDYDAGVIADRTDDGATSLRQLYPATYYDISLQWQTLTAEDQATLSAFLADNRTGELDLVMDADTYRVKQVGPLRRRWSGGAGLASMSLNVRGTRVA